MKKNFFKAFKERKNFFDEILKNSEENSLIHLLYIDSLYKCPLVGNTINKKNIKYIGTLHWVSDSSLNNIMLKSFCKNLEYVIVHSEYLKNKLHKIGIKNVKHIEYPSFVENYELSKDKVSLCKRDKQVVISCLGGTRYDKGLDILANSFKYIGEDKKNKLIFNIAGKEQDIKYDYIRRISEQYNITTVIKNKFLTNEEYELEVMNSDVILLPYRKSFCGNSGPMTDGVYLNKFILGPDRGNLGYLISKHNLGLDFKQEDPIDLANKISRLTEINLKKEHEYRNQLKVEKFIEEHKKLYRFIKGEF